MKLTFQDNISESIKKVVEDLIISNKETNGKITVEYIPEDEVEDYDLPTSMTDNADEIYDRIEANIDNIGIPLELAQILVEGGVLVHE